jgi:hypothetical protein
MVNRIRAVINNAEYNYAYGPETPGLLANAATAFIGVQINLILEAHFREGYATSSHVLENDSSLWERVKNLTAEIMNKAESNGHECDC